jgi:hypothetical protein
MELDQTFGTSGDNSGHSCRFALGICSSHDKSMRLAMTVGYRVFVCDNMAFQGDFTPLLAKHTKNFNLLQALSYGVDQMQRNFEPMVKGVEIWQASQLSDVTAPMSIYRAFIEAELDVPRGLSRAQCTTFTSARVTSSSSRGLSGVCRMLSHRRLRNWSRSHNSGSPQSWQDSLVLPAFEGI